LCHEPELRRFLFGVPAFIGSEDVDLIRDDQRCNIVSLVVEVVRIALPSRSENMITDTLAVQLELTHPVSGGIQSRHPDNPADSCV
jgi:hypothetical protein